MNAKPFMSAAEQNRDPIFQVLKEHLQQQEQVLELGSGTGQHACYFAEHLPHITWQPSELKTNLAGIRQWIAESGVDNIEDPVELDVGTLPWPVLSATVCYTSNTLHIVSWEQVKALFAGCAQVLSVGGRLIVYGPFRFAGKHIAPSNESFDHMLQQNDPLSGVRDVDELNALASLHGFGQASVVAMPVNNHMLFFTRQ